MILVDTSIWIDFIRHRDNLQTERLRQILENAAEVVTCPPILQEILQGARSEADFRSLRALLAHIPLIDASSATASAIASAELFARCRWKGLTLRSPLDCSIAHTAIENNAVLFHHDRDFLAISEIAPKLKHQHFLENNQ